MVTRRRRLIYIRATMQLMKILFIALTCFVLGGISVYGILQYQKVRDENVVLKNKFSEPTPTGSVMIVNTAPSSDLSPTEGVKSAVSPTPEKAMVLGSIEGTLGYPSSGIPELQVIAFDATDVKKYVSIQTVVNQGAFVIGSLTPGTYHAVAYTKDGALSGGYTQSVPCGLSVECTDHSLIDIIVKPGETTKGVAVKDWYAPEGTFPKKP